MSTIRDVAGEARFYVAGMKAVGLPEESVASLNRLIFQLEEAGTHLAPIKVGARFLREDREGKTISDEMHDVTLDIHIYETSDRPGHPSQSWISVHMHGGPTGYESFVLLAGAVEGMSTGGWYACFGTRGSYATCTVSAEEMQRAFTHWGRRG